MPAIPFDFPSVDFMALLERELGEGYVAPMRDNVDAGYEILAAFAAVADRVLQAVARAEKGSLIIYAEGGARSTFEVAFSRPTAAAGALVVKAGTVVKTSAPRRRFVLMRDVAFGAADLGPKSGAVRAIADGYEYNVSPPQAFSGGRSVPGEVDEIDELVLDPPHADQSLAVEQVGSSSAGAAASLDACGDERGVYRESGEADDQYRLRLRSLPDTVSPGAVDRLCAAVLQPLGLAWEVVETWRVNYQSCWDAPSPNSGTPSYDHGSPPSNPRYDDATFVFDDPRGPRPFRNWWLDELEARGAFIVVVRQDLTVQDCGMAYDDPGAGPANFRPVGGPRVGSPWRGTPAYDSPGGDPAFPNVFVGAYDGYDLLRSAAYAGLFRQLQVVKAVGVAAIMDYYRGE